MRWLPFFILAYCFVALQMSLGGHFIVRGAQPNLPLILAAFIALSTPRDVALIGCIVLGLMQDIATVDRFGIHALSYGILALLVGGYAGGSRQVRNSFIVHFLLTLIGGVVLALIGSLQTFISHDSHKSLATALWAAVYSALLSPLIFALLNRLQRAFQFELSRRGSRF